MRVCEVTADGDEVLAACLCPLILASDHSHPPWPWLVGSWPWFTSPGLHSPHPTLHTQRPTRSNFRCKVSAWGSNLQNQVLFSEKTSKENSHITLSACSGKYDLKYVVNGLEKAPLS